MTGIDIQHDAQNEFDDISTTVSHVAVNAWDCHLTQAEACLAASRYAEREGLIKPYVQYDSRVIDPCRSGATQYVLLKAGGEENVHRLHGFQGDGPKTDSIRIGSPQIIVPVTCHIDSDGNVEAYASCHYPATRHNVSTIDQMQRSGDIHSLWFETEWPSEYVYDFVPSRYLYGGETKLMHIDSIEKFMPGYTDFPISFPYMAINLNIALKPNDKFEPIIETGNAIVIAVRKVILIITKHEICVHCSLDLLHEMAWIPDTLNNRKIVKKAATISKDEIDSIDDMLDSIGLIDGLEQAISDGMIDDHHASNVTNIDKRNETQRVLEMLMNLPHQFHYRYNSNRA